MYVVGTAGHVDHGKSTLVEALTGTHPDRLKEEQAREMTIDLGFAWFNLPNGEPVGIVDVPGHRDFIENMLAGVGGIDAAILVIAADEGVMPQTREHLAILDLLEVPVGLIALTKCDLVESADWLDMVEADIRKTLMGTRLMDSPILRVSARTGSGLSDLINQLEEQLTGLPKRKDLGKPRLPIDRVFTIQGFGTVVTGTLLNGSLHSGDEIVLLPSQKTGKIRGLQTHKTKEDQAEPGQRTAVNLGGIDLEEVKRGDILARPDTYFPSRRVDAEIRLLKDCSNPLTHHTEIKFYLGAKETVGMVRLLDCEVLRPGASGFVQLELREPVIAVPEDRFILRRPSPPETIGGGVIINAPADRRYKRFDPAALKSLAIKQAGDLAERYLQYIQSHFPISIAEFRKSADLPFDMGIMEKLAAEGRIILLEGGKGEENRFLIEKDWYQTLTDKMIRLVENYHKRYTLKLGMPREELNSKLGLDPRVFGAFLVGWSNIGIIVENGTTLRLFSFSVEFTRPQQAMIDSLMEELARNPYSPPSVKDLMVRMGEPLYQALINGNVLRQVSREVFFEDQLIQPMTEKVTRYIQEQGSISLAQCRDLFNTSRKFAQAFLEYLDETGITVREGDIRHLKSGN